MTFARVAIASCFLIAAVQPAVQAQDETILVGDAVRGERLYRQRCAGCHALDRNRAGPSHRGVYGREAGAVENYRYSAALRESGLIWNSPTLDSWLANPPALVPGTSMGVRTPRPQDRADLIAYLRSLSVDDDE
jgi:cytochrome c